jgi:hypothetical protein
MQDQEMTQNVISQTALAKKGQDGHVHENFILTGHILGTK